MSRLGNQPIILTDQVKIEMKGSDVTVSGPKGTLELTVPDPVTVEQQDNKLLVSSTGTLPAEKALHGMVRSRLQNMVLGTTEGFRRELEIQGVGYRGQCKGSRITLNLGYSHQVEYDVPEGVDASMPSPNRIVLESIDKQKVGQCAADLRSFRPPDSYKGKGIRYVGEQVSLKEGKTVG